MIDEDALFASTDLVRRAGAKTVEIGYLDDDVPTDRARWYAQAEYRGARVIVENHAGPVEAAEALARRLLTGGTCRRCGEPISLEDATVGCRWRRTGRTWEPGCGKPIDHAIAARQ